MFYAEVTLLRKEGRRLPRREWAPPIYGRILVQDAESNGSNFRRLVRHMTLTQQIGAGSTRTAASLYDPYFLPSAEGAVLIAGLELVASVRRNEICEHGQIWMCRTRTEPDRELPPVSPAIERLLPEV